VDSYTVPSFVSVGGFFRGSVNPKPRKDDLKLRGPFFVFRLPEVKV